MKNHNSEHIQQLIDLSSSDKNFARFTANAKKIDPVELEQFLNQNILNRQKSKERYAIDSYCISSYENLGQYENALKIAEELLDIKLESVVIRSLFRICRKIGDYERANKLLDKYPAILKRKDFHTLYELVYYFKVLGRWDDIKEILKKIEKNFPRSLPILKTVKNFYLQLGLLEDVERVETLLSNLSLDKAKKDYEKHVSTSPKNKDGFEEIAVQESESGVTSTIKELYSKLEHQTRLAAISDLSRGFSHEFGQPITNIRFTIQFYRDIFKGEITKKIFFTIFDSILEETERLGELIKRLSPITSSKSFVEEFDIIDRIQRDVNALAIRLQENQIHVNISPLTPILLKIDPVKFDQVINNLLLNALDAIIEKEDKAIHDNYILIYIEDKGSKIRIVFSDTGKGVPFEYREKIFDPFVTTKNTGKGQGLGLFIVWNILKMQGGEINLDTEYKGGARFLIDIPKETMNI